jgi:hypothetical protein
MEKKDFNNLDAEIKTKIKVKEMKVKKAPVVEIEFISSLEKITYKETSRVNMPPKLQKGDKINEGQIYHHSGIKIKEHNHPTPSSKRT